ncbi:glycoside hydrolase family 2, partial [bacterium]
GTHRGGYDAFSFDVTEALRPGANEIVVRVQNPLKVDVLDAQVVGKQRAKSEGIFYTAATGIWQTVWMEPVDSMHFERLKITPDVDAEEVRIAAPRSEIASDTATEVTVTDRGRVIAKQTFFMAQEFRIKIPKPHLWTPEDPHLYGLRVRLIKGGDDDEVESYFAMRKISLGKDERGRTTILLNNRPYFQVGTLDQGYWPDGLYTAPTDAALKWDIETTKRLGFNMIRKHAKTEPDRFYYWTDKLGMLVWQDMPQAFTGKEDEMGTEANAQWETEWREIMGELHSHPSIVVWTVFNEGWGQHETPRLTAWTKNLDPSRLVNSASGWFDREVGDLDDVHAYPEPGTDSPSATRAAVNGEFGGITMRVPGHMWTEDVMGYGTTLTDTWSVTKRYQELMRQAYALRQSRGTCAFVYTQITDVEQESNGLLTYDRAVW